VTLAGTNKVAIGPADLDLAEGTNTIVYAWGSAEDGNLDLAVQTIDGLHSAPSGVPGGEAGLAPESGGIPAWTVGLGAGCPHWAWRSAAADCRRCAQRPLKASDTR
jgi:hypothetical protein